MDNQVLITANNQSAYSRRIAKAAQIVLKEEVTHLQLIPAAAVKLLKLTQEDNTRVQDLSKVIETEPVLAAKVLRIVNSAAFCLPRKITSIHHAVNMLGFSAVRQAALDQLFYNRLIRQKGAQKFDLLFFWQHSLFVATLSRSIAVALKHPNPDMVYTGGLLHDIGKVVLESYGRLTYSDFLTSLDKNNVAPVENETAFFGLTHAEMGHVFSMAWGLPEAIAAMISFHHEFPKASSPYTQFLPEIAIISFADYVAWVQGLGSVMSFSGLRLPKHILDVIEVDQLNLSDLLEQVDQEMLKTREFYGISFPGVAALRAASVQTAINMGRNNSLPASQNKPTGFDVQKNLVSSLTIPHRSLNVDEFVPWTLDAIRNDFSLDRVFMLIIDPEHRSLVVSHGSPSPLLDKVSTVFEIPINSVSSNLLNCLRQRKPVLIGAGNDHDQKLLQRLQADEFIMMPIARHNRLAGVIYADNSLTQKKLTNDLLFEMLPIVNELGVALLNAKQYDIARKQSQIDPLTQLFNKRIITQFLTRLFRGDHTVLMKTAVGFIDIDKFKIFNDVCGHQAGDDVLKIVADILRNLTRPGDLIGRYGGEEFLFVLLNTDEVGALRYAERIRQEIERRGQILSDRFCGQALTVSVGLALYSPLYNDPCDIIEAADQAMYQAKHQGRNRVITAVDAN